MGGLKKELGVKVLCFILVYILCLFSTVTLAAELRAKRCTSESRIDESDTVNNDQIVMREMPVGAALNISPPSNTNTEEEISAEVTIEALTMADTNIDTKATIAKSLNLSASEAAFILMSEKGGGNSAQEVSDALINSGYGEQEVRNYLGSIISGQENVERTPSNNINQEHTILVVQNDGGQNVQDDTLTPSDNWTADFLELSVSDQAEQWHALTTDEQEVLVSQMNHSQKRELFSALGGESSGLMETFGLKRYRIGINYDPEQYSTETINTLINNIDISADYMADMGYDVVLPSMINLGNGAGSNSGNDTTWNLVDTNLFVVSNKVAQTTLRASHTDLGYDGIESLAGVFTDLILQENGQTTVLSDGQNFIYDESLVGLDNNTMRRAFDDYEAGKITAEELDVIATDVANNHRSISQSLLEVNAGVNDGGSLLSATIDNLSGKSNVNAQDILNACLQSDQDLNGGANRDLIIRSFSAHGINQ